MFTVKSGVLEKWRKSQDDFEKRKFWKKVLELRKRKVSKKVLVNDN